MFSSCAVVPVAALAIESIARGVEVPIPRFVPLKTNLGDCVSALALLFAYWIALATNVFGVSLRPRYVVIGVAVLPPLLITTTPPVAEMIGFCGVPEITMLLPALIELMTFEANTLPVPASILAPSVASPPIASSCPFTRSVPETVRPPATESAPLSAVRPFTVNPLPIVSTPLTFKLPATARLVFMASEV